MSNLVSRDAASVLRDLKEPSASINPDFVAYQVTRRDDSELTGFIRTQDADALHLVAADGKETVVRAADLKEMRPSSLSLMPAGLLDTLKDGQIRDLLTFLLHEPPKRTRAEIAKMISTGPEEIASNMNDRAGGGKQDHGPGQHDYPAWQKAWHALLAPEGQRWKTRGTGRRRTNFNRPGCWCSISGIMIGTRRDLRQLDEFLARGAGIVLLHSAAIGNDQADLLAERTGLASYASPRTKYRHMPLDLNLVAPSDSPITHGLPAMIHFLDEPYWPLTGDTRKVEVLASAMVDGEARPLMWTFEKGKGRIFASILGHYTSTLEDPLFRILILRGIAWAGGADPAALEQLAIPPADAK